MDKSAEHAVTVLISRRVKPGHDAEFERLCRQLMEVAASFAGYLGSSLVHPGEEPGADDGLYHVVLAFDRAASLQAWQDSPARALGLAALAPHIDGEPSIRHVSGLAHWFQPRHTLPLGQPPRWKVAIVTWLGICPTVYAVFLAMGPWLGAWPLLPRVALMTAVVVAAMTWLVAPQLTRLFRPWLYRTRSAAKQ
ncbi:antibiotic biosynthesis monooxygenase [Aquabacterium sp. OR-4]|uniref:antibiotic biosynthesis monooxygenase n=1 Tax=Aquabacterium sp. OR-4 TaxID=2978127 RepID=UPI0028C6D67C|nr:antibiotic biosynthesis monooxygenase [Aquabacterium sp. OR-4]MDT7839077.1 antibiotic biosynthesis monooxygenase [Aquabacterium sp. OR-4]